MDQNKADKLAELASMIQSERDKQVSNLSLAAAQRGEGLAAGPVGGVGIYNQDRFIRPTVEPLVQGILTQVAQQRLQDELTARTKAAQDRLSSAYNAAVRRQRAAQAARSGGGGGNNGGTTSPGENTITVKKGQTANGGNFSILATPDGGVSGYSAKDDQGNIGGFTSVNPQYGNQVTQYIPPTTLESLGVQLRNPFDPKNFGDNKRFIQ